jgi:hypothetical protein
MCAQCRIASSASTLLPSTIPHESVNPVFNELGPIPRLCIDYLGTGLIEEYRKDVQKAISNVTTGEELERLFQNSLSLTMNAVSHKKYLISRQDKENLYGDTIVSPITPAITSRLTVFAITRSWRANSFIQSIFTRILIRGRRLAISSRLQVRDAFFVESFS